MKNINIVQVYGDKNKEVYIYSIPFMSSPVYCDEKMLRNEKYLLKTDLNIFTITSLESLAKPVAIEKIDMLNLRLIIDFSNKKILYMDAYGVIKFNNKVYYTFPWLFLYIFSTITYFKEKSKGVNDVFIRL